MSEDEILIKENASEDPNVVPFLPLEESKDLETLFRSPGLQKLVREYYDLAMQEELSAEKIKRKQDIYQLALYDEQLSEWIAQVDEVIAIVRQLETKKLSIEEFINLIERPPEEMTPERFQAVAKQLRLSNQFLSQHIRFSDRDYHRSLIFQFSTGCVYVIAWKSGQRTAIHSHPNDLSLIRVLKGTLTHRFFEQVNHLYDEKAYRLKQKQEVETNQWGCVNYGQFHQLANESEKELVTLHFRFFRKQLEIDEFLVNDGSVIAKNKF